MNCKYCKGEAVMEIYNAHKIKVEYTEGVLKIIDNSGNAKAEKWQFLKYCPECGARLMGGNANE